MSRVLLLDSSNELSHWRTWRVRKQTNTVGRKNRQARCMDREGSDRQAARQTPTGCLHQPLPGHQCPRGVVEHMWRILGWCNLSKSRSTSGPSLQPWGQLWCGINTVRMLWIDSVWGYNYAWHEVMRGPRGWSLDGALVVVALLRNTCSKRRPPDRLWEYPKCDGGGGGGVRLCLNSSGSTRNN